MKNKFTEILFFTNKNLEVIKSILTDKSFYNEDFLKSIGMNDNQLNNFKANKNKDMEAFWRSYLAMENRTGLDKTYFDKSYDTFFKNIKKSYASPEAFIENINEYKKKLKTFTDGNEEQYNLDDEKHKKDIQDHPKALKTPLMVNYEKHKKNWVILDNFNLDSQNIPKGFCEKDFWENNTATIENSKLIKKENPNKLDEKNNPNKLDEKNNPNKLDEKNKLYELDELDKSPSSLFNMSILAALPRDMMNKDKLNIDYNVRRGFDAMYALAEKKHIYNLINAMEESGKSSYRNSDLSGKLHEKLCNLYNVLNNNEIDSSQYGHEELWRDLYATADSYLTYKDENGYNKNAYGKIYAADSIMKLCRLHLDGYYQEPHLLDNKKPTEKSIESIIKEHTQIKDDKDYRYGERKKQLLLNHKRDKISYSDLLKEDIKHEDKLTKKIDTSKRKVKQKDALSKY